MMDALKRFIGHNDMMAYLTMMCIRLLELKRVLKYTGSIYLHCDPTASHYLKILMDTIFGAKNFRNEIVWCYAGGGIPRKDFPRKHDIILRYSISRSYYFNPPLRKYSQTGSGIHSDGSRYDKEKGLTPHNDWWTDLSPINSMSKGRLGYPTQKPIALLERIIKASSNEGDVVLDPFCGCGTSVVTAQKLSRKWIGIDLTHLAVNLMKHRLKDMFKLKAKEDYKIIGEPEDI
jgi:site-specific DNA-methyltransferase (adenine-specific)